MDELPLGWQMQLFGTWVSFCLTEHWQTSSEMYLRELLPANNVKKGIQLQLETKKRKETDDNSSYKWQIGSFCLPQTSFILWFPVFSWTKSLKCSILWTAFSSFPGSTTKPKRTKYRIRTPDTWLWAVKMPSLSLITSWHCSFFSPWPSIYLQSI